MRNDRSLIEGPVDSRPMSYRTTLVTAWETIDGIPKGQRLRALAQARRGVRQSSAFRNRSPR